jgi:hypothetical protein
MKVGDHAEPFDASGSRRPVPQLAIEFAPGRGGACDPQGVFVTPASWLLLGGSWLDRRGPVRGGPPRLRLVLAYVRRSRAHDPNDVHRINQQRMVVITCRTQHVPAVEWSHADQVQGMSGPTGGIAQISY